MTVSAYEQSTVNLAKLGVFHVVNYPPKLSLDYLAELTGFGAYCMKQKLANSCSYKRSRIIIHIAHDYAKNIVHPRGMQLRLLSSFSVTAADSIVCFIN